MVWVIGILRSLVLAAPIAAQAAYGVLSIKRQDKKLAKLIEEKREMLAAAA